MAEATRGLLHVMPRAAWEHLEGSIEPAAGAAFVHCCTPAQLDGVLARYFADVADLVIVRLDADRLAAEVVWEDTTGAGEAFPHVYGAIPRTAVIEVTAR